MDGSAPNRLFGFLWFRLKLMDQLPQLYSRLRSSQAAVADPEQPPLNISRRNYFRSKSGRSLYVSICNMHQHISQNQDWFEKQLSAAAAPPSDSSSKEAPPPAIPGPSSPPEPTCSAGLQPERRFDSGLVLNEVLVRTPSLEEVDAVARRNVLLLAPGSGPGRSPSPELPHCSASIPGSTPRWRRKSGLTFSRRSVQTFISSAPFLLLGRLSIGASGESSSAPCVLREEACPASGHTEDDGCTGPEVPPPRDSGIYDSSVPSSELSIPLMEGLSQDQMDSASLADSESSSSGLGNAAALFTAL